MDIRKLVNSRVVDSSEVPMTTRSTTCWQHHQTLPPVSSILHDHAYTGHHYPMPPHGEGMTMGYPVQYQQQQPQPQQQQQQYAPAPQYQAYPQHQQQQQPQPFVRHPQQQQPQQQMFIPHQQPPPSYHHNHHQELPYMLHSQPQHTMSAPISAPTAPVPQSTLRASPSTTAYSRSTTSAERRSLSTPSDFDDDEDDIDVDESLSGGSTTPILPPYVANPHHNVTTQVCFVDTPPATPTASVPSQIAEGGDLACDVCGVSYSRAPDLRRHKATVHNDRDSREKVSTTFPCEVCNQILLSSHGYQGHMRRHYDERPFVCEHPTCSKAFHDSATLARHRRTHSTEHKFECDFCNRRFKRKDNLNTHRKKHLVGGERINVNLLRKPVVRVTGGGSSNASSADSPSPSSTNSPPSPIYPSSDTSLALGLASTPVSLPLASPPYQQLPPSPPMPYFHHQQAAPPYYQHPHQGYAVKAEAGPYAGFQR